MGNFSTELEIIQDESFAIKAPKGFKGDDWRSKSGRPGRVLFSKHSPDYISSDCYITVSTVAKDPITSEIRRRVESCIGIDGFNFQFTKMGDKNAVFYSHEEEVDYKTYHAFILLSDKKAVLVDVIFNVAFDNAKEIANTIISSIKTNFKGEVTPEELAEDEARLAAESQAEEAKRAQREAAKKQSLLGDAPEQEAPVESENLEEEISAELVDETVEETESVEEDSAEEAVEESNEVEESEEPARVEPEFDDSDDGIKMRVIYENMKTHSKMTLSELQIVPELIDVGRMGITGLMNKMIRQEILVRFEDANNIYFALPGQQPEVEEEQVEEEPEVEDQADIDRYRLEMDQYKLDMEQYKAAMAEWKKSKDFFGRTEMPKPVEPVKPKKKK